MKEKARWRGRPWLLFSLVWLLGAGLSCEAETKYIRLRNELIATTPPTPAQPSVRLQSQDRVVSGLCLIQFRRPLEPEWREELRKRGIELVRFVPEDAFVARVENVRFGDLCSLPFVQWVGEYRPDLRVHPALQASLGAAAVKRSLSVRVLLSPQARPAEAARAILAMQNLRRLSKSSLGTVLDGEVTSAQLRALAGSEAALWIEPAPRMKLFDEVSAKIVAGGASDTDGRRNRENDGGELSVAPSGLRRAATRPEPAGHATLTQQLGFDGRGVTVAVADSGLSNGDRESVHPDLAGRIEALFYYGDLENASDEHSHGTHVAGIIAGDGATGETDAYGALYGLGVAPKAHLVIQRLFDGIGNYRPPPGFETLTRDAVRAGAVIGSNSWGDDTQGRYDLSAAEFDALVRDADAATPGDQPYILEFSAGNAGPAPRTIGTPAVAKNVIAVGASQNNRFEFPIYSDGQDSLADFSSRGPCEDGRIKPDLVAPGTWIASLQSAAASDQNAWAPISPFYQYQGGTSQAGPHVSGAAAVFVQYYRDTHGGATPSPALVKAALINSAVDPAATHAEAGASKEDEEGSDAGRVPNASEGWGRVDLTQIIGSPRVSDFTDQTTTLSTGQVFEKRVVVSPDARLKITLVYTDVPGLPSAIPALVNDLDLEAVGPDGKLYRGNAFFQGESVPDTPVGDALNNVEAVHLAKPLPGGYLVRVRAKNVVEDIHHRIGVAPEQDFALVISGDLPQPGEGFVFFERGSYSAPATAKLGLIDSELAGQAVVNVRVTSSTEPAGESIELQPSGAAGLFTGTVSLVQGEAELGDGQLQVAHGDELDLFYQDAGPPFQRRARATVDLAPPQLTSVASTNRFGRTSILWKTDEPASSMAVFGPPSAVSQVISNQTLQLDHRLDLPPLEAGQPYQFYVVSADAAGNAATNNNEGLLFKLTGARAATVLLVHAPEPFVEGLAPPYPRLEAYTAPLEALGVNYEIWDLAVRPAPTAADLKPFRAVIWRPTEFDAADETFSPAIQKAISKYLAQGGALFLSSMEVLSRLTESEEIAFQKEVLHVDGFSPDGGASTLSGISGDPISKGSLLDLNWFDFPDTQGAIQWPTHPDHLTLATNAAPVFLQEDGKVVGLRYPRTGQDAVGRVVFFSFPFEAVPESADAPNNRVSLLGNALEFLVPGLRGVASIALDANAYTLPSAVTVEVSDTKRSGAGQVQVKIRSTSDPEPKELTLPETVRKGIFRAFFTLESADAAPTPARLRAKHQDTIEVSYIDTADYEISASAEVDTTPPVISYGSLEPAFNEATVRWQTSKLTDALVRFGEAGVDDSFLSRTAYRAELAPEHEVELTGLLPNREYYFQLVSRDHAGNTAVDNNRGRLHKFRTLKPLDAPWRDDLEQGRTGWAVKNAKPGAGSENPEPLFNSAWRYGVPENEQGLAAHSGTQCWGTNLKGEWVDLAISDLISPAVALTGGNEATLSFWQYYDFQKRSDLFDTELGQVIVSTNNGASWSTLYAVPGTTSQAWQQVEVDLSKFIGSIVRVAWHYEMWSLDSFTRPGWLVDDVSISTTNQPRATLVITNNLAQAAFQVTGPISRSGEGLEMMITNAPLGEYVVTFQDVPFYETPAPQSILITNTAPALFSGHYTFPDLNQNGLSDLWETQFFKNASAVLSPDADADGDGLSNLGEFISGTDPNDAESSLRFLAPALQTDGSMQLAWPAAPGHRYRLLRSTDVRSWTPGSEWIRAGAAQLSISLPAPDAPRFYRLEVGQ